MHSQRLREKCLSVWIIAKQTGEIQTAHCDCVAGLGAVCSHVAATLFVIDKEIRGVEEVTSTGKKAYWMPPTNRPSKPKRISEIDFTTAKKKFCTGNESNMAKKDIKNIPSISPLEHIKFLQKLSSEDIVTVSHLVTNPFAENLKNIQNSRNKFFIMTHFQEQYLQHSLEELQNIGKNHIEVNKRIYLYLEIYFRSGN